MSLISLRGFLEHNRRHAWLPEIPADAAIYQEDLPQRDKPLPRFVSEFVMAQLEDDANLALLEPTLRHLVIVLIETGLRSSDACYLPFNPLLDDSGGWPCLRFHSRKVNADQLVPLSGRAAVAIRDQQARVRADWPPGIRWLFPDPRRTPDGPKPFAPHALSRQLKSWERRIRLHDEAGNDVTVTPRGWTVDRGSSVVVLR